MNDDFLIDSPRIGESISKELKNRKFVRINSPKILNSLSLCPHCYCMTYTIKRKCGKCKKEKK